MGLLPRRREVGPSRPLPPTEVGLRRVADGRRPQLTLGRLNRVAGPLVRAVAGLLDDAAAVATVERAAPIDPDPPALRDAACPDPFRGILRF